MGKVRIALTISGAVSLGAFEGGALAALIAGVQGTQVHNHDREDPDLRIDAIGGSSAGAITAVMAARAVTAGLDPIEMLRGAWVDDVSLPLLLRGAGAHAPLTMNGLRAKARDLLDPGSASADHQQRSPVRVQLSLCNLRGLEYKIRRLDGADRSGRAPGDIRRPLTALTYLDMAPFTIRWNDGVSTLLEPDERSPVDFALASGANEFGFSARLLSMDRGGYEDRGVENLPMSGVTWYTDGGTLENEPLGRTFDLTSALDRKPPIGDARRIHLLIHPFPDTVVGSESAAWADRYRQPAWLRTLGRALEIIRFQSLYADFKRAEKVNSRIAWRRQLTDALRPLVDNLPAQDETRWRAALTDVLDDIDADRDQLRPPGAPATRPPATGAGSATRPTVSQLLEQVLDQVTGLSGKHPVSIDVVSPFLAEGTEGLSRDELLAGEAFFAFGGFFEEGLRLSDFALGYVCMLNWMSAGLGGYGLDDDQAEAALAAALLGFGRLGTWPSGGKGKGFWDYGLRPDLLRRLAANRLPATSWKPTDFGRTSWYQLLARHPVLTARLASRVYRVTASDIRLGVFALVGVLAAALRRRLPRRARAAG